MKRSIGWAAIALAGLTVAAQAQTQSVAPPATFREGTPVVIVGMISSQPRDFGVGTERKMQVAVGPQKVDYTLHLSDAKLHSYHGTEVKPDHFMDKMWLRAEGTVMDDPRRIKVAKLQVIGKDMPSLRQSAFYRPGLAQGYVMAVAGARQVFPSATGATYEPATMAIVGRVSDDTGTLETTRKVQVDAAGNTWTMNVPQNATVVDTKGEKISVHEIAKGQWIRAHGWQTEDLRMRVARIENIGAEEAYRGSAYYRANEPVGYVERMPGAAVKFNPLNVTGTITAIDERAGTVTLRDGAGKTRTFYLDTVTVHANSRPVSAQGLRTGQRVTVRGSEIQF